MKRLVCLLLCCMTVMSSFCFVTANATGSLEFDEASPYSYADGVLTLDGFCSAYEISSAFRGAVAVTSAAGETLTGTDAVTTGASVCVAGGEEKASVVVLGDVDANARINVRDVIGAMKAIVDQIEGLTARAADVDADGDLNAKDVVSLMKYLTGWDVTFGAERAKAANDDDALDMYFTSTMYRIAREDTENHGTPDGVVYMAKNEVEDAHIVLTASAAKSDLTLEIGDIKNADGKVLDREVRYGYYYNFAILSDEMYYSRDKQDWTMHYGNAFADPYPTLKSTFNANANESRSFIVKVKTTADTASGWYRADVRVLDGAKNELKKAELCVYVWNFALDETPACRTLFGMSEYALAWGTAVYDGEVWHPAYTNDWFEYSLENKITPWGLPGSGDTDRYMDDPRVTAFVAVEGSRDASAWDREGFAEEARATYEHLATKQEWLDKAYIYTVDEPWTSGGAYCVKKQWEKAKEALGDIPFKTILPISSNCWMDDLDMDMFEYCLDYCNAICPQSNCFTLSDTTKNRRADKDKYPMWAEYMADGAFRKYGQFQPRFETVRERGDDVWWYICIGPQPPYANWWMAQQGAVNRAVLWQQYLYDIDGILYWDMTMWNMSEKDSRKINLTRINNGDGLLFYNGALWDETKVWVKGKDPAPVAVPSIRLEAVRDGIEDFQYLRQLERQIGRDAALEYTNRVTTDILVFSQDYHDIESTRHEMGFKLEELAG